LNVLEELAFQMTEQPGESSSVVPEKQLDNTKRFAQAT
jgi:hypothetical protein